MLFFFNHGYEGDFGQKMIKNEEKSMRICKIHV